MSTEKIVLGHCEKTGKKFGIEVRKGGTEYRAVNFVELKESEYAGLSSKIAVNGLQSGSNLLACKKCSSRKVAG